MAPPNPAAEDASSQQTHGLPGGTKTISPAFIGRIQGRDGAFEEELHGIATVTFASIRRNDPAIPPSFS
jgi:hypothetical protein